MRLWWALFSGRAGKGVGFQELVSVAKVNNSARIFVLQEVEIYVPFLKGLWNHRLGPLKIYDGMAVSRHNTFQYWICRKKQKYCFIEARSDAWFSNAAELCISSANSMFHIETWKAHGLCRNGTNFSTISRVQMLTVAFVFVDLTYSWDASLAKRDPWPQSTNYY